MACRVTPLLAGTCFLILAGTYDGSYARGDEYSDAQTTIKAHCAKDWPDDFEMRRYCEQKQNDGLFTLKKGKPNDIELAEFKTIRTKCAKDWPDDFEMRAYCEKKQYDGIRELRRGKPDDISQKDFEVIRRKCSHDWPDDFEMRAYCEKKQYDAVRESR